MVFTDSLYFPWSALMPCIFPGVDTFPTHKHSPQHTTHSQTNQQRTRTHTQREQHKDKFLSIS